MADEGPLATENKQVQLLVRFSVWINLIDNSESKFVKQLLAGLQFTAQECVNVLAADA